MRRLTQSEIKSAAIDLSARECAKIIQACITHLEHCKIQLGYPGTMTGLTSDQDAEGESLAISLLAAMADQLPLHPKRALINADDAGILRCDELEYLQDEVREAVLDLLDN